MFKENPSTTVKTDEYLKSIFPQTENLTIKYISLFCTWPNTDSVSYVKVSVFCLIVYPILFLELPNSSFWNFIPTSPISFTICGI